MNIRGAPGHTLAMNRLATTALVLAGLLAFAPVATAITVPDTGAVYDSYLASSITATVTTSMTLASGAYNDGTALSGFTCFTLDSGTPSLEYACGTASGTSVTALYRGLRYGNPNGTSSALAFRHGRGSSVKITDYPTLQLLARLALGTDGYQNVIRYDSSVTTSTISADANNLVSVGLLATATSTGCVDASETARGCSQLGTKAQLAAGTSAGSQARIVAPGSAFSATPSATTTVPVTGTGGTLAAGFLDQTAAYSWSGAQSFSATTTLTGAIVASVPVVHAYVASTTWTKPAKLAYAVVETIGGGAGGGACGSNGTYGSGGASGGYARELLSASALSATSSVSVVIGSGGASAAAGTTSTFGSFLQATGGASTEAPGLGSGGDLNAQGGLGAAGVFPNQGGDGHYGGGALRRTTAGTGNAATLYGGGGGGGSCIGASPFSGGAGAPGLVTVTEYFL